MRFENASAFKKGLTFTLLMFLLVFPFNLSAQSSVQQERLTFVRLTSEQYRNSIRDIFGESIAKFHSQRESYYGYGYDTYIGSLLQENKMSPSWKRFYLNQRFDCLLSKMKETLSINRELNDKILTVRDYIDRNLSEPSKSTLIHGDIWSGNILVDNDRNLKIIDPALFYADNEYELAYIYLNGTFSRGFYDSYNHNNPISNDFWPFKIYVLSLIHI